MKEEQFRELLQMADKRDEKRYAFLRQLLLLASGALTLLVSLKASSAMAPLALWSIRLAWLALGLGILLLAVALHGDIWTADALTRRYQEWLTKPESQRGPIVVTRPPIYRRSERAAYACFATTVVALVVHALALTR